MTDRIVAFDLEIARQIPEGESLDDHHPLGISVAAIQRSDLDVAEAFYGNTLLDGTPAHRMDALECRNFVGVLADLVSRGYTLVTWNGLGFDFRILAEESGLVEECKRLALGHIDMMLHFFCLKGFAIGLQASAEAWGLGGKLEGVTGADVPRMWAEGDYRRVTEYVGRDVRTTLNIYRAICREGRFSWINSRGTRSNVEVPGGKLLRVYEALALPEPDTSWMKPKCRDCDGIACSGAIDCPHCGSLNIMKPWPRSKFSGWLSWLE